MAAAIDSVFAARSRGKRDGESHRSHPARDFDVAKLGPPPTLADASRSPVKNSYRIHNSSR
jgi:hypothetical protein